MNKRHLSIRIEKKQEGQYIPIPFEIEAGVERIDIHYTYSRVRQTEDRGISLETDVCAIDFALEGPGGTFVGASGCNRSHLFVSPYGSSVGFARREVDAGVWRIIAGAYRVPNAGVTVEYEIELTMKHRRLFHGDTHAHTLASDGSTDIGGLLAMARGQKLDFFFVTDHNSFVTDGAVPLCDDITIMSGTEWTHYKGHAGLLGVQRAFYSPYYTKTKAETAALLREAQRNGAFVVLNHPFCSQLPWEWGFDLPFDAIEVWNGIMAERNERAIHYWHTRLSAGDKIPATSGSDYHRQELFTGFAVPCMCLYASSRSPKDLLDALRHGSGYISYQRDGPGVDILCDTPEGVLSFGDSAPDGVEVHFRFFGLRGGDEIHLITDTTTERIQCTKNTVALNIGRSFPHARFVRAEIFRSYEQGLPLMRALLSNPIYFSCAGKTELTHG